MKIGEAASAQPMGNCRGGSEASQCAALSAMWNCEFSLGNDPIYHLTFFFDAHFAQEIQ